MRRAKKKIFELRKIIYRKKLTIKFRSLTSNGRRGALINTYTVEHPLPVLTSPRPTTTFYKLFRNLKYAHTIEIQGATKRKHENMVSQMVQKKVSTGVRKKCVPRIFTYPEVLYYYPNFLNWLPRRLYVNTWQL